ncbi:hypothetical protein [Paenibacillus sanguinis]|uniref:hypothetical protein n=1 Tax=Paenibacillus sanguinis TaxID=225906 RepID=UPI000372B8F0|nr:hypothetical protein [Paenibacillus sanguinis]
MKAWKRIILAAVVGLTTWGSLFSGAVLEPVSAAPNAVPSYEVKFIASPEAVLTSEGQVQENVREQFNLPSTPELIGVAYYDTNDLALNEEGWSVRFRKKEDKSNYELTYKKRYPILNGDVDAALTLANQEGFDASDDNYEAEVDWGYSKQTLSFSNTKKEKTKAKGPELPADKKMLALLLDELPGKLNKWSAPDWGEQILSQLRAHGPLVFERYRGEWEGQELTLEVWPIRNSAGTGVEHLVELSFKTDDYDVAAELRPEFKNVLEFSGWLLPADSLKTQLILQRY